MAMIRGLVQLTLLEAIRVRLGWIIGISLAASFGLAQFIDQVALVESRQIQAVILAAALRFSSAFIVMMFVVTSMVRESNDKVTDLLLSMPVSRATFLAGKLCGYFMVALIVGAAHCVPLALLAPGPGLAVWSCSLLLELTIVAAISLFCVLSLTQTVSAIAASAGFYLLARAMGTIKIIAGASLAHTPTFGDRAINLIVDGIALLLPDLDRMSQSGWLVDPPPFQVIAGVAGQAAIYIALLGAASLFDLYRKNL